MQGYTVKEAATVLGVPRKRVWELIARGVLAGSPEAGGGMRVFLGAGPMPAARAPVPEQPAPARTNGTGGTDGAPGEMSPFRELLTEFRSLTERYGQALLALGEARGEVASLRSRVDLLEARLDLRLPGPMAEAPAAWTSTQIPPSTEHRVEPVAPPPDTEAATIAPEIELPPVPAERPSAEVVAPAKRRRTERAKPKAPARRATSAAKPATQPRRTRPARPGAAGIAAALARASDPSRGIPEELAPTGAASNAAPTAAPAPLVIDDEVLPSVVAAAEPVEFADEEPPAGIAAAVDVAPGVEAAAPAAVEPSIEGVTEAAPDAEVEAAALPAVEAEAGEAGAVGAEVESAESVIAPAEAGTIPAGTEAPMHERPRAAVLETPEAPAESEASPTDFGPHYTTAIEEPDWFSEADLDASATAGDQSPPEALREAPARAAAEVAPQAEVAAPPDAPADEAEAELPPFLARAAASLAAESPPADASPLAAPPAVSAAPPAPPTAPAPVETSAEAVEPPVAPAPAPIPMTEYPEEETILWLGAGPEEPASEDYAAEMEVATPAWHATRVEGAAVAPEALGVPSPEAGTDAATVPDDAEPDEMELGGYQPTHQAAEPRATELPGGRELEEALAELDAIAQGEPTSPDAPPAPQAAPPHVEDEDEGPAQRAIERLRRLFPN